MKYSAIILQDFIDSGSTALKTQMRAILIHQDKSSAQFGAFRASVAQLESDNPHKLSVNPTFPGADSVAIEFVLEQKLKISLRSIRWHLSPIFDWRQIRTAISQYRGFSELYRFISSQITGWD